MTQNLTQAQVANEAFTLSAKYIEENSWFRFYSGDAMDPKTPDTYAQAAGKAYRYVQSAPGMLLLGDTKLRSDSEIVSNFGLSGLDTDQDRESRALLDRRMMELSPEERTRAQQPLLPRAGAGLSAAGSAPPSLTRAPSSSGNLAAILSNPDWSPMLNDSFIMGGIHAGKKFHLALVGDERAAFDAVAPAAGAPAGAPPPGSDLKDQLIQRGIPQWKAFFISKPIMLWNGQYPRVFARELLGLAGFGYKAIPAGSYELAFERVAEGEADTLTLGKYLAELKAYEFQTPTKSKVIKRIAKFLFQDEDALNPMINAS